MFILIYFCYFLYFLSYFKLLESKDYLIWLKNDKKKIENGYDGKEYLNSHILSMKVLISSFKHYYTYNNLVMYGYLVYSASIDDLDWNEFIEIGDIKLAEEITTYKIAQSKPFPVDFIPFAPPSIDAVTVSREGLALCTVTYDYVYNISTSNSTFHKMDVYVLDTGIQSTHKAFEGRVIHGYDVIDSPPIYSDPNGHGTQVAGIIGGKGYGINPLVNIIDVRVADADGYTQTDKIISGLDFVLGHHMKKDAPEATKSIVNLSLTGKQSKLLEFALYIVSKTMLVVGANGDDDAFSCWKSPASSDYVLSVGGVMRDTDTALPGSNYGDCADILAPGENIPAPYIGSSNIESKSLTGTSASAAVVTGIATHLIGLIESNSTIKDFLYLTYKDSTVSQFLKDIMTSTKYTIVNQTDTAHLNLYISCDFSILPTMDSIFAKELKLVPKKRTIPALNRAKKTLLDIQSKQKAAMFD